VAIFPYFDVGVFQSAPSLSHNILIVSNILFFFVTALFLLLIIVRGAVYISRGGVSMEAIRCDRCSGEMWFTAFSDMSEGGDMWAYDGWHCVYCGEIVDTVVLSNRDSQGLMHPEGRSVERSLMRRSREFSLA
jgi:hypothetical protein